MIGNYHKIGGYSWWYRQGLNQCKVLGKLDTPLVAVALPL